MESDEEGFVLEEGSSESKQRRQRTLLQQTLGRAQVAGWDLADTPANAYVAPWMQFSQLWLQPQQMPFNNPWMMGGQSGGMPYGNPWMMLRHVANAGARQDSVARVSRRQRRNEYDAIAVSRMTGGGKN
jgi:hypothetical protein